LEIQDVNESMVKLKCALDDAEHMAFQLMRSNSDTGQTLQFIKLSFHATSFEQLLTC